MTSIRRRSLLATLGSIAFAGCTANEGSQNDTPATARNGTPSAPQNDTGQKPTASESSACEVEIVRFDGAQYAPERPVSGPMLRTEVLLSTDGCTGEGVVSFVAGDVEVEETVPLDPAEEDPESDTPRNYQDFELEADSPPVDANVTVRVEDDEGNVLATADGPLDHYEEPEPSYFGLHCPSVEPTSTTPGETVSVTATVSNYGTPDGYVARLLVGETEVAVTEGEESTSTFSDVRPECPGEELSFEHTFENTGEFDLRIDVDPQADTGSGGEVDVGTVTVEEGE